MPASPRFDLLDSKYLFPIPIRPQVMTSVWLNLLRHYFARPEYMVTERFRRKPNQGTGIDAHDQVLIVSTAAWHPETADKRPAITVRRLKWVTQRLGMGDGRAHYQEGETQSEFIIAWQGGHAVFCHSREGGELDYLVDEVLNCLMRLRPVIRRALRLARLDVVEVGAPSMYTSNKDYFVCPVMLQYTWTESWKLDNNIEDVQSVLEAVAAEEGWPSINLA